MVEYRESLPWNLKAGTLIFLFKWIKIWHSVKELSGLYSNWKIKVSICKIIFHFGSKNYDMAKCMQRMFLFAYFFHKSIKLRQSFQIIGLVIDNAHDLIVKSMDG